MKQKLQKKQLLMFTAGILAMLAGLGILGFFGIRKIMRAIKREQLMRDNTAIVIEALHIKAPVLEGVDLDTLRVAAGHFPDTGAVGSGNYCIAGHSSVLYKEYFNNLKNVQTGMEIRLYDDYKNGHYTAYTVTETFIVEPNETWILDDFGDTRVTLVTCTDDGSQRRIVIGKVNPDEPAQTTETTE